MKEKHPRKCCWNCKYYIPPKQHEIDGPISSICMIDRRKDIYSYPGNLIEGDKERKLGEVCDRWEEREFDES